VKIAASAAQSNQVLSGIGKGAQREYKEAGLQRINPLALGVGTARVPSGLEKDARDEGSARNFSAMMRGSRAA